MTDDSLTAETSIQQHRAALEARVSALPTRRVILASTALSKGGVWRSVRDLAVLLQSIGCDVQVALLRDAVALRAAATEAGLIAGDYASLARSRNAIWHVHLHDTYDRIAFGSVWRRRTVGPSVITEHLPRNHASDPALEPQHPRTTGARTAKTWFKQAEFSATDELIAVGRSSARFLHERYRIAPASIRVVQNGIAAAHPTPLRSPSDAPLNVLAIGSLGRQKGFDVLIEAMAHATRDWRVTIAGSGSQLENLRALSATSAPERVEFVGWVDQPQQLMRDADVVCMPSRWESFPYVALESLAIGRPLVGSRVDGLDEIVDSTSGVLVEPNRPAELARVLDRLDSDRCLLGRLASSAPRRAARYSLARMLSGTLDAYESAWQARTRTWTRSPSSDGSA